METDSKINFDFYLKLKKRILTILNLTLFKKEVGVTLIMIVVSFAIFKNLSYLAPIIKRNLVFLIDHFSWNYDEKMISAVGADYYYTGKLINQKVPPGSVMMIPPQMGGWPESGNPEFSQYFFGPAKLIRENSNLESIESLTHLLIAWGEGISENSKYFGWPRFPAKFEKIYHLPLKKEFYLGLPQINGNSVRGLEKINYINSTEYEDEKNLEINEKVFFQGQPAQHLAVRYSSTDSDYFWIDKPFSNAQINNLTIPIFVVAQKQIPTSKSPPSIQRVKLAVKVKNRSGQSLIFITDETKGVNRWEFLKTESFAQQLGPYILRNNLKDKNFQVASIGLKTSFDPAELYEVKWGVAKLSNKDFRQESRELDSQKEIRAGHILSLSSQKTQAKTAYLNSFDLDRTDPWPLYWASEIVSDNPDWELEYLMRVYRHSPDIPWFSYKLGLKYGEDLDLALKFLSESLQKDPTAPWAHMGRGEVFEKLGRLKKALEDYEEASELNRYLYSADAKKARLRRERILGEAQLNLKKLEISLANNPFDTSTKFELLKVYHLLDFDKEQKFKKLFDELNNVLQQNEEFSSFLAELKPQVTDLQPVEPVVIEDFEGENFNQVEGVKGKALVLRDKDFVFFNAESFPNTNGSIQFFWKPPTIETGEVVNLFYQFSTKYSGKNGFLLWAGHDYLGFAIYDGEGNRWQEILGNSKINWENRWYKITLSYGAAGMRLFLDGKIIGQNSYSGGIGTEFPVFLGSDLIILPLPSPKDKGAFDELVVYNFQIAEDSR